MSKPTKLAGAAESGSDAPTCSVSSLTPETDAHQAREGMAYDWQWSEFSSQLERERNACVHALNDASQLLAEIMRDEVNHQDEAEKWLRSYAPEYLFPQNVQCASAGAD